MKSKLFFIIYKLKEIISISSIFCNSLYRKKEKSPYAISSKLIDKVYSNNITDIESVVDYIMKFSADDVSFIAEEERSFPGNPAYVESGYYHTMLKRYVFAGKWFCEGKSVLDSCSGLGWGTYLLSNYANDITAFDISRESIDFASKHWAKPNIKWIIGDALNLTKIEDESFDVAIAMETIEHFTKSDGKKYIETLHGKLRKDGFLIGSSAFPFTVEKAETLCSTNPYHLHVFTFHEMDKLLGSIFKTHKIINNWMFVAQK